MPSDSGTMILQDDGSETLDEDGNDLISAGDSDCDCCGGSSPNDWNSPPSGTCGDNTEDTAGDVAIDFSTAPWSVSACPGVVTYADAPTAMPYTLVHTGSNSWQAPTDILVSDGAGGTVAMRQTSTQIGTYTMAGCQHYGIQVIFGKLASDPGVIVTVFIGPKINGAGSKTGRYFWWHDATTVTTDANGFGIAPTPGCTFGNVPAYIDVP